MPMSPHVLALSLICDDSVEGMTRLGIAVGQPVMAAYDLCTHFIAYRAVRSDVCNTRQNPNHHSLDSDDARGRA